MDVLGIFHVVLNTFLCNEVLSLNMSTVGILTFNTFTDTYLQALI